VAFGEEMVLLKSTGVFLMTQLAQRREIWDRSRIGICVTPVLFSALINDLVRKVMSSKRRQDLTRRSCSSSF